MLPYFLFGMPANYKFNTIKNWIKTDALYKLKILNETSKRFG